MIVLFTLRAPGLELRPLPEQRLENRRVVEALAATSVGALARQRAREGESGIGILEAQGGYDAYLGRAFRRVSPADVLPNEPLRSFLYRTGVAAVVIEDRLVGHHRVEDHPDFDAFFRAPEAYGFTVTDVPGTSRRIAYRNFAATASTRTTHR